MRDLADEGSRQPDQRRVGHAQTGTFQRDAHGDEGSGKRVEPGPQQAMVSRRHGGEASRKGSSLGREGGPPAPAARQAGASTGSPPARDGCVPGGRSGTSRCARSLGPLGPSGGAGRGGRSRWTCRVSTNGGRLGALPMPEAGRARSPPLPRPAGGEPTPLVALVGDARRSPARGVRATSARPCSPAAGR